VALSVDLSKLLGKGAREAEQARLGLAHAERALGVARTEVVAEVTRAYFDLATKRAALPVREEAVAHALKLQALQTLRFEHGATDLSPLLQAIEALARTRLDLLRAQQEAHVAALALRHTLGLSVDP
jgi:outer membrane protein TolC